MLAPVLSPVYGFFVDRRGIAAGLSLVNTMGIAIYALQLTPGVVGLCVSYVMFGCFRVWNFTSTSMYVQRVFGNASFGRVYGLGANSFNLIAAALQYSAVKLALDTRSFLAIDIALAAMGVPVFVFPLWMMSSDMEKRTKRQAQAEGEEETLRAPLLDES